MKINSRRYDIDWLRVLAVLLLIPFHSLLVFVLDPYSIVYIKDTVNCNFFGQVAGVIHQFHMPILFIISGISTCLALNFRSGNQYLKERFFRLLVPTVFGITVLVPPMTYITRIARGEPIPFLTHLRGFFSLNLNDMAGIYGTFTPAHLWFILFLFVFSLIGLPFFLLLRRKPSEAFQKGLARFFSLRCTLFLLALPIALAASVNVLDDKNPLVYFLFFFLGYLLVSDDQYYQAIERDWPVALALVIIFEALRQTLNFEAAPWSLPWILFGLMIQINRWLWVLALLGLGRRFLNSGGPLLRYLSQAAFPIYILHLPLNTLVGYFVIKLPVNIGLKYLLIVLVTNILAFAVYEIIKPIGLLRFLLGMKVRAGNNKIMG
jgi:peptidoglycan/LPS O-acetylase OafA/YrhL